MSRKKKIALAVLCVVSLFLVYEIIDWNTNRYWIGTTKETEIVQQHWIPIEKELPELEWKYECGDGPENYFEVWTDLPLFGQKKTLDRSCWKYTYITIDNPQEYVKTHLIPWLKNQGFTDIYTDNGKIGEEWSIPEEDKEVYIETRRDLPLTDTDGYLALSVLIHFEPDNDDIRSTTKPSIYININQFCYGMP